MKTILIIIDHGLSLAYFLYTDLAKKILEKNVHLIFLVQDDLLPKLREDFAGVKNLEFESMREKEAEEYKHNYRGRMQEVFEFVRGSVMSPRIPLTYVDTHRKRKLYEAGPRYRLLLKAFEPWIYILRFSSIARKIFMWFQCKLFTPKIYEDILDKYKPDLVLSGTAGWRNDRYLLREAKIHKIKTGMFVIGWDNPSCNGLPGAPVQYANVWSSIHKWELNSGLDWPQDRIHIGGIPLYDNYLSGKWQIGREEYFRFHELDPHKKLIVFVATALSITPNFHIIEGLVKMIREKAFNEPVQLLIRLHPNHFKPVKRYIKEREAIFKLTKRVPDVHVVSPKALAGDLPRYSGEDFEEKASMLAYCDLMISIYSTMVLEASLHDKPIISACINIPEGWPDAYWIPLDEVPGWPTATRVVACHASQTALTFKQLHEQINAYLQNPALDREGRKKFARQELTFLKDGEATAKTAKYILSLIGVEKE